MRIIAYAYACEPDKGSEPGAGWALARLLGGFAETHVITRANNRASIERALPSTPERNRMHFHYVDLPDRAKRWKRGQRGVRLYYLLWQRAALRKARQLHAADPFDVSWHLTLGNAWLGSNLGKLGVPFVLGPVGGGIAPPHKLLCSLGIKGLVYEASRALMRFGGRHLNPNASSAWNRARLILTQNRETTAWFPRSQQHKCRIFQHALLDASAVSEQQATGNSSVLVYVGRLIPWKGVGLAIQAVARVPEKRLVVFGNGPDRPRLERLAKAHRVADRVDFRGSVDRDEVGAFLRREAGALLFPSLHDDSPLAVAEAVAAGVPVICLNLGGPPLVAGKAAITIDPGSEDQVIQDLARAIATPERWPRAWDRLHPVVEHRRSALLELVKDLDPKP